MAAGLEAYQIFIKFSMIHCKKIYFYINMYIDIDIERIFFLEMLLNLVQWNELKKKRKWKWYVCTEVVFTMDLCYVKYTETS